MSAKKVSLAALTKHLDSLYQDLLRDLKGEDAIPSPALEVVTMLHRVQIWAEHHAKGDRSVSWWRFLYISVLVKWFNSYLCPYCGISSCAYICSVCKCLTCNCGCCPKPESK